MTTPVTKSPVLSSFSIATTVSNASSDNLASPTKSPPTSGALSPLGLDSSLAPARTFKEEMKQKKLLSSAHSAFTDERTLDSEKYLKFQKVVKRIKAKPPDERHESKRGVAAKTFNSPRTQQRQKSAFVELSSSKVYFEEFPIKLDVADQKEAQTSISKQIPLWNAHVGQAHFSAYHRPVTAYDIDDSIAVFWQNEKEVYVVHLSSGTNTTIKDVFDRFAKFPREKNTTHRIYIVGGNGSPESVQLLHNIHSALLIYFGANGKIVESFINPNKTTSFHSVSVACTPQKKFFFCRHD